MITPSSGGRGTFTVHNEGDKDAVVFLVEVGHLRSALAVYVHGPGSCTVNGVPDGSYQIFFSSGWNWNSATNTFARDPQRFILQ